MKKILVILFLFIIIGACTPQYKVQTWILYDTCKVGSHKKIIHYFRSLGYTYATVMIFDSTICKIGDTINIKPVGKIYYLLK